MSSDSLLYDEYSAITQKYLSIYGRDSTVVLMQVGKFFEYYNCDRNLGADVGTISRILGVQATKRNKSIPEISRKNPAFGGFPCDKAYKFVPTLLEAGYTVVMYVQEGESPNITRKVTEILSASTASASTFLNDDGGSTAGSDESTSSSCLMAVHLDASGKKLSCGWSVVDLSTGRTYASEASESPLDVLRRVVVAYRPMEAVLFFEGKLAPSAETVCSHVGMRRRAVHDRTETFKDIMFPARQNEVLSKAYPNTGFLTPAEYVNLERHTSALIALVAAIEFAHEHNPGVVSRIRVPELIAFDEDAAATRMDLGPDTIRKLDVISDGRFHFDEPQATLLAILNRCKTPSGKRAFRDRLIAPICDPKVMEGRYDAIARLIVRGYDDIVRHLSEIGDLERMFRKVVNFKMIAKAQDDLSTIASWLRCSEDALRASEYAPPEPRPQAYAPPEPRPQAYCPDAAQAAHAVWAAIDSRIEKDKKEGAESYFRRGVHASLDAAQEELDMALSMFHSAASAINVAIGAEHVKVDTESGGLIGLFITAKRWTAAVASGAAAKAIIEPWFVGSDAMLGAPTKKEGGVRRLEHPALGSAASERVVRARSALESELQEKTRELIEELDEAHSESVRRVIEAIDDLDVAVTCARNARDMGHVRPRLISQGDEGSFISVQNLRHPIVESLLLDRKERYVPNDISLGGGTAAQGMLLYGVNSIGKSSLMKGLGLAVIMAQSGMYVAADSLELRPFHELYTRVGLHDDLTRGHSTFVCEMLGLRSIIRQAGRRSLVIGDELCAGTESPSALSIVGAAVARLADRHACFLFATHLHELNQIPEVEALMREGKVSTVHLSVRHNPDTGLLIMDRKLSPGTGPPTYGLEVCRSLDMDPQFMAVAESIRKHVLDSAGMIVPARRSRYNARVIVDACEVCGKPATETHHLVPQATAEPHVKNRKHNLAPLCEKCHDEVHAGALVIEGYKATSEGVKLNFAIPSSMPFHSLDAS